MNRLWLKNIILTFIPTLISVIGIVIALDIFSSFISFFIYLTVGLLVLFFVFVIYYSKLETKDRNRNDELISENENLKATVTSIKNLLNVNNSIVTSFVSTIEPWTSNINKIANDIKSKGMANEKDWDYEKICTDICIGCKKAIKEFTGNTIDTDLSVGFIKYIVEEEKEYVKMVAHSSPQTAKPDIFDVQELLSDCNYQYAKLIRNKTRSILALENNQKIVQCFYKKHPETNLSKYTQYIAIPILCTKNKTLGVLQITTKYNYKIMESEVDLKKFSETYVTPFVDLLILVEKLQKGLFIKPSDSN